MPVVPEADLAPLRQFLHDFRADPPERTALLLSYREDHRRLMEPLGLPARREGEDWRSIEPLGFAEAERFLRACPGLDIPEGRMRLVLREAAEQEGGRVIMRPIVANMLGIILARMAGHPTLWRRSGDLLCSYVRDCLAGPLEKERAAALRELLTDFHTARPRAIADIAGRTGLDPSTLNDQLGHLELAGLVRCLNDEEGTPARRIWQIAHDFIATLTERVLDAMHRTLWRAVKPWLAPASIALWLLVGLGAWPWVEKQRNIAALGDAGLNWSATARAVSINEWGKANLESLDGVERVLRRLQPRTLDLSGCGALQNVDVLKGLTSLQSLNLALCGALHDVDGLKGLTRLQSLDVTFCPALQNVDVLKELTSLRALDLSVCRTLQNVDVLKALTSLRSLDLSFCTALSDAQVAELQRALPKLKITRLTERREP